MRSRSRWSAVSGTAAVAASLCFSWVGPTLGCGGAALVAYPLPVQPPGAYRFLEGHRWDLTVPDGPDPAERDVVLRDPAPYDVERIAPDGRGWRFVHVDGVGGWIAVDDIDPRLVHGIRELAATHPDLAGWVAEDYPFGDPRWRLVEATGPWGPSNRIFDAQTGEWTTLSGDVESCSVNRRYPDQMCCSYDLMGTAWISVTGEERSSFLGCRGG